jgi:hypothetical protein
MDVEELIRRLSLVGGSHVHDVNKATYYLRRLQDQRAKYCLLSLIEVCEKAVAGDWAALHSHIHRWW